MTCSNKLTLLNDQVDLDTRLYYNTLLNQLLLLIIHLLIAKAYEVASHACQLS